MGEAGGDGKEDVYAVLQLCQLLEKCFPACMVTTTVAGSDLMAQQSWHETEAHTSGGVEAIAWGWGYF